MAWNQRGRGKTIWKLLVKVTLEMFPIKIRQVNSTIPEQKSRLKHDWSYAFRTRFFFFFFHTCHIPGAWSISKCCPNSIRISSWLRRNFHCGERRSHRVLYPYIRSGLFPAMWRLFLYWISPGLHLLNTNTESWHLLQNILLGMTCWKRNQNVSSHLAACQLPQLVKCGSSVFPGIYKD